jgi:hypothetical protein
LLDPENGNAPSDCENHGSPVDYSRNAAIQAFEMIGSTARSWNYPDPEGDGGVDDSRFEIYGPSANDVVIIKKISV